MIRYHYLRNVLHILRLNKVHQIVLTQFQFQTATPSRKKTICTPPYTPAQMSLTSNQQHALTNNGYHVNLLSNLPTSRLLSRAPYQQSLRIPSLII